MIDEILEERQKTHGAFETNAMIAQELKRVKADWTHEQGHNLSDVELEAIDMIFLKLSRIITNGGNFDAWADIAGYATLAAKVYKEDE